MRYGAESCGHSEDASVASRKTLRTALCRILSMRESETGARRSPHFRLPAVRNTSGAGHDCWLHPYAPDDRPRPRFFHLETDMNPEVGLRAPLALVPVTAFLGCASTQTGETGTEAATSSDVDGVWLINVTNRPREQAIVRCLEASGERMWLG